MNKLQIRAIAYETSGGYGGISLWEVAIDGNIRFPHAKPFCAADSELILEECLECGQCGRVNCIARRTERLAVWIYTHLGIYTTRYLFAFELSQYEEVVGGSARELPVLAYTESIEVLRQISFPDWRTVLFSETSVAAEVDGKAVLKTISDAITDGSAGFVPCEPPAQHDWVEIWLDTHPSTTFRFNISSETHSRRIQFEGCRFTTCWFEVVLLSPEGSRKWTEGFRSLGASI